MTIEKKLIKIHFMVLPPPHGLSHPLEYEVGRGVTVVLLMFNATAAIAVAIDAEELLIVSDVPGVMAGGEAVDTLTVAEARGLMHDGQASGGMRAKLSAAIVAVTGGVKRVRITDLRGIKDRNCGTIMQQQVE